MSESPFSDSVRTKARRYVEEGGRVRPDDQDASVWWVQGSRATSYRVQTYRDGSRLIGATCGCRFGGTRSTSLSTCSHVAAVLLTIQETLSR